MAYLVSAISNGSSATMMVDVDTSNQQLLYRIFNGFAAFKEGSEVHWVQDFILLHELRLQKADIVHPPNYPSAIMSCGWIMMVLIYMAGRWILWSPLPAISGAKGYNPLYGPVIIWPLPRRQALVGLKRSVGNPELTNLPDDLLLVLLPLSGSFGYYVYPGKKAFRVKYSIDED